MKKIILIIFSILVIFQMVVLATAIDIGSTANDLDTATNIIYTRINMNNPANDTGKITSIDIWAVNQMAGVEVATFYAVDATHFSTRDYETVNNGNGAGVVLAGSKQTFTVDLDVVAGDYIGIYGTGGTIEYTTNSGTTCAYFPVEGDNIPCTNLEFTVVNTRDMSIGGTGGTGATVGGVSNIFMGVNF
jgi:hypothetical protein